MTNLRTTMANQITQALLRKERRAQTRAVRKQSAADRQMVARRRAAEDRALAREFGIEVDDFVGLNKQEPHNEH